MPGNLVLRILGLNRSDLESVRAAPMQGAEGAPDAWIELEPWAMAGLHRVVPDIKSGL